VRRHSCPLQKLTLLVRSHSKAMFSNRRIIRNYVVRAIESDVKDASYK
jgi:hypothetical protein